MEEVTEELRLLKEELNAKFDRLFKILESAESANVLNEENQDKVDEDRIPRKFKLSNVQLNELRIFFGYRNEAEKLKTRWLNFSNLKNRRTLMEY